MLLIVALVLPKTLRKELYDIFSNCRSGIYSICSLGVHSRGYINGYCIV